MALSQRNGFAVLTEFTRINIKLMQKSVCIILRHAWINFSFLLYSLTGIAINGYYKPENNEFNNVQY